MCGIIGYVGKKEKTLSVLIEGLKNLEYRGYDSAGVAYPFKDQVKVVKQEGKICSLEKIISFDDQTKCGIGHTRWATHGKPSVMNAHPHSHGKFTLVHNGIIENAGILKEGLKKKGVIFDSDTDTEVAVAVLNDIYQAELDIEVSIQKLMKTVKGSYAFAILCEDDLEHIYVAKNASPLIIGVGKNEMYIASDVPAILNKTNQYQLLEDMEYAKVGQDTVHIYTLNGVEVYRDTLTFEGDMEIAQKHGYEHFMLKEMMEQPEILKQLFETYFGQLDTWRENLPDLRKYQQIDIVACGSAYHAGLVGKYYIEEVLHIPVCVSLASEYRYQTIFPNRNCLVIAVSQSGETADTLACLKMVKEYHMDTLAIVNVVGSSIAREADYVLYTKAGYEIAVATTKAYTAQVLCFLLLTFAYQHSTFTKEEVQEFYEVSNLLLQQNFGTMVDRIRTAKQIFFLGRQRDYALSMEASLKLKEISYLMSVAYAAGELKHGTISLIEENTPVIAFITDPKVAEKTISNIKEVRARGAYVIVIVSELLERDVIDCYDEKIVIPNVMPFLTPIAAMLPMQLLAYEVAKKNGCEIDQPRNLAKSVTVE